MSQHNLMVHEMQEIRRKVSDAWAQDLDAWSRDRQALEAAVCEASNRTAEVIELRNELAALREVGIRQIEEFALLKAQYDTLVASSDTPGVCPPYSDGTDIRVIEPEGETKCYNHMEVEAKASGAREVYMNAAVPGPPHVPFEKLKPCCQIGWFNVVEFIERPLLAKLDRAERALKRAGFQDLGGQEWKPPLGKTPDYITEQIKDAVDAVQSVAAEIVNDLRLGEHAPSRTYDTTNKRKEEMIDE